MIYTSLGAASTQNSIASFKTNETTATSHNLTHATVKNSRPKRVPSLIKAPIAADLRLPTEHSRLNSHSIIDYGALLSQIHNNQSADFTPQQLESYLLPLTKSK